MHYHFIRSPGFFENVCSLLELRATFSLFPRAGCRISHRLDEAALSPKVGTADVLHSGLVEQKEPNPHPPLHDNSVFGAT